MRVMEKLRRLLAASPRASVVGDRRMHHGHQERVGGGQELNLAMPRSSWEEGLGGSATMGLTPPLVPMGGACRRPLPPPSVSIAPCPIFARRAHPMLREVHFFEWHREKFYDSKMSHTAPITQTYRFPHTPTVFIHRFEFLRKAIL